MAGREVFVVGHKIDRYGRVVGKVMVGNSDVCLAQVADGFAWHFKTYAHEQSESDRAAYAKAEDRARKLRRGLWEQRGAIPPWDWRSGVRAKPAVL